MKPTQEKLHVKIQQMGKALKMEVKISIEPTDYWGDANETSRHILLAVDGEQRSQRLEDWENSHDSFGALIDIIPDDEARDRVEQLIETKKGQ